MTTEIRLQLPKQYFEGVLLIVMRHRIRLYIWSGGYWPFCEEWMFWLRSEKWPGISQIKEVKLNSCVVGGRMGFEREHWKVNMVDLK